MTLRAFVLGLVGTGLVLGLCCGKASADCVSAKPGNPYDKHYTLTVDNRCRGPVQLAVCWRWPGGAEPRSYRLSRAGSVTFLGPDAVGNEAASTIWLRCSAANCMIACSPVIASTKPPAPALPAPAPAAPPPPTPPPTPTQWGAMAAGIEGTGTNGTGHVGVGWAVGSDEAAVQKAVNGLSIR